jgi:hypothetical protein
MSKLRDLVDLDKRQVMYNLSAGTNTNNIFKTSTYVDFYLSDASDHLDQCRKMVIEFTVSNTSGGVITAVPTFNWVSYIEYYFNNDLLDTSRLDHSFVSHGMINGLNLINYGTVEGYRLNNIQTGGITSDISLASGQKTTYYLPLINNIFCTDGLLLSSLKGQIKIRVYFGNVASTLVTSGDATNFNLDNMQLLISGIKYDDIELIKSIAEEDDVLDTIAHRYGTKNLGTLSNDEYYDVSLEMLKGSMEYTFFYIKKSSATLTDFYQSNNPYYYSFSNLQLVDSDGTNTGFYSSMSSNFIKSIVTTESTNNQWLSLFSIYMLPFSTDPYKSYNCNCHTGSVYMDGRSLFRFKPNIDASLLSEKMNLVVLGFQQAKLYIRSGVLSIEFI